MASIIQGIIIVVVFISVFFILKEFWKLFFYSLFKSWFTVLMIGVGVFAFVFFEQGLDVMRSLHLSDNFLHSALMIIATIFWGYNSWSSSRVALDLSGMLKLESTDENKETLLKSDSDRNTKLSFRMHIWFPRVLGGLPFVVMIWGLIKSHQGGGNHGNHQQVDYWIVGSLAFSYFYMLLFIEVKNRIAQALKDRGVKSKFINWLSLWSFYMVLQVSKKVDQRIFQKKEPDLQQIQVRLQSYDWKEHWQKK